MQLEKNFPSVVKYMGSKTDVLDLIEKGINYFGRDHNWICDLFAGSATLSAALRGKANIISNDIQEYSEVFTKAYLNNYDWNSLPSVESISEKASERAHHLLEENADLTEKFSYNRTFTLSEFKQMETGERELFNRENWNEFDGYYLFTKCYSGTYWSFEQCVWIDSYRAVIDEHKENEPLFNLLLTCLMYAMAYNSQSTGHYAQYRIPDNDSSMNDILIYRRKNITEFFDRKFKEFHEYLKTENNCQFIATAETDVDCLMQLPDDTLVYADPPYSFVHYSRFYHILETLVRYDYPKVKYKGRYRTDRYQSEYCRKTEVGIAFEQLFRGVREKKVDLVLSYTNSDTNTIEFSKLLAICLDTVNPQLAGTGILKISMNRADEFFSEGSVEQVKLLEQKDTSEKLDYEIAMIKKPYNHSRMGRTVTKTIPVTEVVIIAKHL